MKEPYSTYEEFEAWVNNYRDEIGLPRLQKDTIKECYETLKAFHESWNSKPVVNLCS